MSNRPKRVSFTRPAKRHADGDVQMGAASSTAEQRDSKKSRSSSNNRGISIAGSSSAPAHDKRKPYGRKGVNQTAVFKKTASGVVSSSKGAIDILKEFLAKRYDPLSHLLDLENMAGDAAFANEKGLLAPGQVSHSRTSAAPALWKLVGEQYPNTISISLANNKLATLVDLAPAALVRALPNLQNLSLKGNQIVDVKALNSLATDDAVGRTGLNCLMELVLEGNPVREVALSNGTFENFAREIATRFPTLTALDGQSLIPTAAPRPVASTSKTPLGSGLKQPAQFPLAMRPGFSDDSKDLVASFLIKYFTLFDSNRAALFPAYSPQSTFSLSTNSAIPFRAKASKAVQDLPKQHKLNWQPYFDKSRNMVKTHKVEESRLKQQISKSLFVGPAEIVGVLANLPGTKHPLTEASKFVVDGWTQIGIAGENSTCLFVSLHGEFIEEPGGGYRSFDRSFVLAPPASTSGPSDWPCQILSDQWVVRGFSEPKAWSDTALRIMPTSVPAGEAVANGNPQANGANGLSPHQQSMIAELQKQTRLNLAFAQQCLSESGWDLPKALEAFKSVASQIPPEAFV